MDKKNNNSDIQTAKEEISSGRKETATTVAMKTGKIAGSLFPSVGKIPIIGVSVIVIILFLIIGVSSFSFFGMFGGSTSKKETISIIENVQELATLATAEAIVTTIIKEEDNKLFNKDISMNFPGTKRTALLIVPATVLAGVDLKSVTEKNFNFNEEKKKITLIIPHATLIQEPSIQMDKVQTYSEEGIFRSEVSWDKGFDLAAEAMIDIKKEAIDLGLLTKAEDSALKVLRNFFRNLGYDAQIEFK